MNNKGQAIFAGIMIFIMVFITVVILIEPIKDQITISRDVTHLDCDNASITTGQKATCVVTDFTLFYFVGMGIAAGAAYLTGRWLQGRGII